MRVDFAYCGHSQQVVAQKALEMTDIPGDDFEHVIPAARHRVALDDFRKTANLLLEMFNVFAPLTGQVERGEHDDFHAQLLAREQRNAAVDQTLLLDMVDAAPAG